MPVGNSHELQTRVDVTMILIEEQTKHFGVRAHLEVSMGLSPLSGPVANAPAAMGLRWRFFLHNLLGLCGVPKLPHVSDECRAHVVLCPSTRLRSQENREYHKEQLR